MLDVCSARCCCLPARPWSRPGKPSLCAPRRLTRCSSIRASVSPPSSGSTGTALNEGLKWTEGFPIEYQPFTGSLTNRDHPATSIAYFRVYWKFVEPEPGCIAGSFSTGRWRWRGSAASRSCCRIAPYGTGADNDVPGLVSGAGDGTGIGEEAPRREVAGASGEPVVRAAFRRPDSRARGALRRAPGPRVGRCVRRGRLGRGRRVRRVDRRHPNGAVGLLPGHLSHDAARAPASGPESHPLRPSQEARRLARRLPGRPRGFQQDLVATWRITIHRPSSKPGCRRPGARAR